MPRQVSERVAAWPLRREGWLVYLFGALVLVSIPVYLGYLGMSWDALNHHIYLGWTAEHARFDQDYVAAGYQSYQFPYLYWPFYKLAMAGVSGATAGAVLALLQSLAIPPIWLIARTTIPGDDYFAACMRGIAVVLAFMSGLVLSFFDSTANDLMAAIPLLWAYAVGLRPVADDRASAMRAATLSGACAGIALACKLSNGFLVIAMPVLWLWPKGTLRRRLVRCAAASAAASASFVLCYGYWGWQLWTHFGNPIYPFYDSAFAPLRASLGWQP